ncbi:hypothetical protein Rhe02_60040 [Rhizocola hellebori]|uniref:Uncharacterized protein n=1 Tax=Rhizocola hellebori TaxID=1392758 RepID=A0A8J3QDA7_9ACTN|nr:hypothetical protein [Rhizocola hellebori]GIH07937.1 hypothetical protein Rhe02_60040 [Rhizocola hellebori]
MGRVEDYLDGRLKGSAIPQDLRRLVELQLDGLLHGPDSVQPFAEVRVLAPGELHSLQDPRYRGHDNPGQVANGRAMDEVLAHAAVVVDGFNGDLFGYWLHPDEPATGRPAILKLDTEGQFDTPEGATLVEAMVFDWLGYDEEEEAEYFAEIVEFCERHGLELSARSRDQLVKPPLAVDPVLLHDRLYRTYQPFTPRPEPAQVDTGEHAAAVVGLGLADEPLRGLLAQLGLPEPEAAVAELDTGTGEVRLQSPLANVTLTFYLDAASGWWLYSAKYRRPTPELALELPLPYGFSFADDRRATHERFGPPKHSARLPIDRWQFGGVVGYVAFEDEAGLPSYLEFWPANVPRRS